ncbi:MAG: hypothetical protein ACKO1P_00875, partial [Actinomycetota bacterium]
MKKLLVIAAGGVAGSLVRYLFVGRNDEIGIFLINLIGVTVAGLFALRLKPTELSRLFWIPGFADIFSYITLFCITGFLFFLQGQFPNLD